MGILLKEFGLNELNYFYRMKKVFIESGNSPNQQSIMSIRS